MKPPAGQSQGAADPPAPAFPTPASDSPSPGVIEVSGPRAERYATRLTLRLDDLASALGVSRRALECDRSAGRPPRLDLTIGRRVLCRPDSIRDWIGRGRR